MEARITQYTKGSRNQVLKKPRKNSSANSQKHPKINQFLITALLIATISAQKAQETPATTPTTPNLHLDNCTKITPNCIKCNKTVTPSPNLCTKCALTFFLFDGTCTECHSIPHCLACQDFLGCTKCIKGYELQSIGQTSEMQECVLIQATDFQVEIVLGVLLLTFMLTIGAFFCLSSRGGVSSGIQRSGTRYQSVFEGEKKEGFTYEHPGLSYLQQSMKGSNDGDEVDYGSLISGMSPDNHKKYGIMGRGLTMEAMGSSGDEATTGEYRLVGGSLMSMDVVREESGGVVAEDDGGKGSVVGQVEVLEVGSSASSKPLLAADFETPKFTKVEPAGVAGKFDTPKFNIPSSEEK